MKITLPTLPFDVPPKPKELTGAPSASILKVRKVDPILLGDESRDYIDAVVDEGVPMGKRQDWRTPEPSVQESEISEP